MHAGHPFHGVDYQKLEEAIENVHQGLTFSGEFSSEGRRAQAMAETFGVWWLGFDCSHAFDTMPAMDAMLRRLGSPPSSYLGSRYWTVEAVREEVEDLARTLKAADNAEMAALLAAVKAGQTTRGAVDP